MAGGRAQYQAFNDEPTIVEASTQQEAHERERSPPEAPRVPLGVDPGALGYYVGVRLITRIWI